METPSSPPPPPSASFTVERRWVLVGLAVLAVVTLLLLMIGATKRPPFPISCTWRKAFLNQTKVCVITITEPRKDPFRMNVRYVNATNGTVLYDTVTAYGSYPTTQLGHLEGFSLLPGDTLEFSHPDYAPAKFTCPDTR